MNKTVENINDIAPGPPISQAELTQIHNEYANARIVGIHRGASTDRDTLYAALIAEDGSLLISATLDYIVRALAERLPEKSL